jgi:hypothetical protein
VTGVIEGHVICENDDITAIVSRKERDSVLFILLVGARNVNGHVFQVNIAHVHKKRPPLREAY